MPELRALAFAAGVVVVAGTVVSVLRTLVLPRGVSSKLSVVVGRVIVRGLFASVARRVDGYERKDRLLSASAPVSLLMVMLTWMVLFVVGCGLMLWSLGGLSFPQALREAGSSTFTLGFASTERAGPTTVDIVAAATGLAVLALVIAYLPVLYNAFNRRETLVTLLQSRAGSPAWGPEILARHQMVDIVDSLADFYREWEQWAADVAESHSTYPVLVWFRSPHPLRSWITGLLAVLDSAALYLSLAPEAAPSEARLCLRMGFTCLRDIAGSLGMPFDSDPFPDDPVELTFDDFRSGVARLEVMGFPMERTPEEAWPHFKGWRVNYESIAYRIADDVVAPPGPWSGRRRLLPGLELTPQRPADRRPSEPAAEASKKSN
jgi:hypothetical protein